MWEYISVELPKSIELLEPEDKIDLNLGRLLVHSHFLRNIHKWCHDEKWCSIVGGVLHLTDLKKVFSWKGEALSALTHRFDNLPIHSMIYYQSYQQVGMDQLNDALANNSSSLWQTLRYGRDQDWVGMTPLHVLTWLYQVLVESYPEHLTVRLSNGSTN